MPAVTEEWMAQTGRGRETWDYSPASLDVLEEVLLSRFASGDQVDNEPRFVDGAARYLGEVLRRSGGGDWELNPGAPDPVNPYVGRPFVERRDADGHSVTDVPSLTVRNLVRRRKSGRLEQALSNYCENGVSAPR